jgi:hypothetical protein
MAVSMKVTVVWDVIHFSLEDRYQNSPIFRVDNLEMEALGSFETLVCIYQSTSCNNPTLNVLSEAGLKVQLGRSAYGSASVTLILS